MVDDMRNVLAHESSRVQGKTWWKLGQNIYGPVIPTTTHVGRYLEDLFFNGKVLVLGMNVLLCCRHDLYNNIKNDRRNSGGTLRQKEIKNALNTALKT